MKFPRDRGLKNGKRADGYGKGIRGGGCSGMLGFIRGGDVKMMRGRFRDVSLVFGLWVLLADDDGLGLNLAGPTGTCARGPLHLLVSSLMYRFAGRFSRMLMKKIAQHPGSGGAVVDNTAVEDEDVGRVLRQVCWQWGLVMDREEWQKRIEGGTL
jgi:hypothetical protein